MFSPRNFLPAKNFVSTAALLLVGILGGAGTLLAQGPPPPPAPLQPPPVPPGNPLTNAKINLGKVLFWDEQLSSGRTVSCGTCHIPRTAGGDPRSLASPEAIHPSTDNTFGTADDVFGSPGVPLSDATGAYLSATHFGLGVQTTHRRTTSALNAGYSRELFWDGRAGETFTDPVTSTVVLATGAALESQSMGPPANEVEMGHRNRVWTEILTRIAGAEPLALATEAPPSLLVWIAGRTYAELFTEAFGTPDITAGRVGMAIASYERTLFTNQTPFDDFLGGNNGALTTQEAQGRNVFNAASCNTCHAGSLLSDNRFHYIGVRPAVEDEGRFAVTGATPDRGRMRTPSLRNLELRAPYMHTGRFATIEDVVEFYNRGGDFNAPNKDPLVRPLNLSQADKDALAAFLKRPLTDPRLLSGEAPFDRPILYGESSRRPAIEGTGLAGAGGLVPMVTAVEPALVGNPSFTVGVQNALGAANALLVIDDADPGTTPPGTGSFAFETILLQGSGTGAGFGSISLAIPADASQVGRELFGRWYVTDGAAAGGFAVSPVFRFEIFPSLGDSLMFVDDFESGSTAGWDASSP